jgi:hypothetical protein
MLAKVQKKLQSLPMVSTDLLLYIKGFYDVWLKRSVIYNVVDNIVSAIAAKCSVSTNDSIFEIAVFLMRQKFPIIKKIFNK